MIYGDLGGFGTNGTNGTIVGHTEWHASGLWMLASSMETVYGKETTYNTKARYRRGVQSRHYSNAFRNYIGVHVLYEKDCWCRRGEGEGRERGIMLCILSILRISCRASSSVTRITYLTFYTRWALGEIVSRCPTCSGSAATGKPHRRW